MGTLNCAKNLGLRYNVSFRVVDKITGKIVSEHKGHNSATDTLITGIGRYLAGQGVLNQGSDILNAYVPQYISLGTMGMISQEEDSEGLPAGLGVIRSGAEDEESRFKAYMDTTPGYGADGHDASLNNGRAYFGLGPSYANRPYQNQTIDCELVSDTFPRASISYREVVPEMYSEKDGTVDIIFSAMISTGALAQFRESGKDYIFITEAGLWSKLKYSSESSQYGNGLLAAYRIIPPNKDNWDMSVEANRRILKQNILRVGYNQVVQVIWKIQIGSISQISEGGGAVLYWNAV